MKKNKIILNYPTFEDFEKEYFTKQSEDLPGCQKEIIKTCMNNRTLTIKQKKQLIESLNKTEKYSKDTNKINFIYTKKNCIQNYIMLALKEYNITRNKKELFKDIFTAIKWFGITKLAKKINMSRAGIYDALIREKANPRDTTLNKILEGVGIELFLLGKVIEDEQEEKKL